MIVLGIATSGSLCSVALCDEEGILEERKFRHKMHLSERLMTEVDSCVWGARISRNDISMVVVDRGPGSFTGVRVGVATAKTLAYALDVPITGITSLEGAYLEHPVDPNATYISVIRARPAQAYVQAFGLDAPDALRTPSICTIDHLARMIASSRVFLCGEAATQTAELLLLDDDSCRLRVSHSDCLTAATAAMEGLKRKQSNHIDAVEGFVPFYLSPPPINQKPPATATST